jgi:DNA-binding transcriptional regulator YdaS (Cro superfamily)
MTCKKALDCTLHVMHIACMKLSDFLTNAGMTDVEFAARIGRASSTVNRWRHERTRPEWDAIVQIERATKGAVTANDFIPAPASHEASQ